MTATPQYIKSQLTDEETRHLIDLGICLDYATPYTFSAPYRTSGIGIAHVFTLANMFGMIPYSFKLRHDDNDEEHLACLDIYPQPFQNTWIVRYRHISPLCDDTTSAKVVHLTASVELIDALYQMLLWLLENKHVEHLTKPINAIEFTEYRKPV